MLSACAKCGREIDRDEIGLTKKLINRGTTTYFCIDCLAEKFEVTREDLEKKIVEFREMGCTLFI